ncbi:MAG: 4-hydroxy-tetrahydrodipicolinate reductase [Saprospiraceae bacterium]|uniref:4-hydroxy-tetrahydrodipicolinate reductase n=1 Tax=Candidatus Opimibacter skivensis TaxID=2982028 RepID=A0A9D7XP84_9BACT|nr:4-hydroxy-tetrahydrodipicolinate reductase [Candidatus Opimibacter skivensis]
MRRFGIIGLGKMGQAITAILNAENNIQFETFYRLSGDNLSLLKACDVVIEFTTPDASPGIIKQCIETGIPIVSGTTGWQEYHLHSIIKLCQMKNGKFLYASNFSIGMNITFALNRRLALIMNHYPQFSASIKEIHHIHKKDSPSGTAHTLIGDIVDNNKRYTDFEITDEQKTSKESILPVHAIREGEVKGFHEVTWASDSEKITISHEAYDRKIFAEGAIMAAGWLIDQKPGVYTMRDIIEL